ncbi:hypothetical protein BAC3_01759 [uncultured bacterium]|nr:hypothetical protein BAC3_01759 [uncultured bacterium]
MYLIGMRDKLRYLRSRIAGQELVWDEELISQKLNNCMKDGLSGVNAEYLIICNKDLF